jgi:hypothetical protein
MENAKANSSCILISKIELEGEGFTGGHSAERDEPSSKGQISHAFVHL